jgi:hypothetical protein
MYVNWTLISVLINVRVLKIYVLGLIDELDWMLWGWLLWVIDYLVDYGRLWLFWVMILFEWWICVRNKERTVGFLLKFWVGGWRWWKFKLVPQFVEITV